MCDRPNKVFILGYKDNGKMNLKFADSEVHHCYLDKNGNVHKCYDTYSSEQEYERYEKFIEVPCGHCFTCRMQRANEWVLRCVHELEYHDCAIFVTLTYDSAHIKVRDYIDEDGCIGSRYTLCYKDFQDYMKRLRKKYPDNNIRYIVAGEYGDRTKRPHYHAIIFGYRPPSELDMIVQYNKHGDPLYDNMEIVDMWRQGYITYAPATVETICYVAQYTLKKAFNDDDWKLEKYGIEKPTLHMSTNPAIGSQWYEDNKPDLTMNMFYNTKDGARSSTVPRYYLKLAERNNDKSFKKYLKKSEKTIYSKRNKELSYWCNREVPTKIKQSEAKERRHKGMITERDF